jgi:hypothetical protein
MAGLFVWLALDPSRHTVAREAILCWTVATVVVTGSLYLLVAIFQSATILTADEIERRDLLARRRMRRSDIAGYRILRPGNSFPTIKLQPRPSAGRTMTVVLYRPNREFWTWFEGVPDLAEEELKAATQAALEDSDFGASIDERRRNLNQLNRIGGYGQAIGLVLLLWVTLAPQPYWLAILVAALAPLAALALVALTGGRFALYSLDARPKVAFLMYPGLGLTMRAMLDIHLYHFADVLGPGVPTAAAAVLMSWAVDRRLARRAAVLAAFSLAAIAYAYGLVAEADVLLDRTQPAAFTAAVLDKRISHGKHTSYDVTLARWGDRKGDEQVDVGPAPYRRLQVGEPACIWLHPGRLGVRWFRVDACPPPAAPT